jgi:hypothetical protein
MSRYLGVMPADPVFDSQTVTGLQYESTQDNLTAKAGGGQAGATQITAMNARVTTVGTAADSVVLPKAAAGLIVYVTNAHATNSMNVFPAVGDAINALSANTAFAVAATKTCAFVCYSNGGPWHSLLTA